MYYLTMMDSWLYDENKPFVHVEAGETFGIIKKIQRMASLRNSLKTILLIIIMR